MEDQKSKQISGVFRQSADLKSRLAGDDNLITACKEIANAVIDCYNRDGKVFFCGNGGSAADAQHLAAELSGRYYYDRPPLYAEALHVNTSYLTAVANDYSFDEVYARMIRAAGRPGDILIALSTSGRSANVLKALKAAGKQQMIRIGLTGENGGEMPALCDMIIRVPSADTPRIQEAHMLIGHAICETVEKTLFPT